MFQTLFEQGLDQGSMHEAEFVIKVTGIPDASRFKHVERDILMINDSACVTYPKARFCYIHEVDVKVK